MSGRLGLLIKPNDNFRLGLSVTTPTFLELTDEYYDELFVVYDNGGSEDLRTIDKQFTYMVNTPARLGIQGAYIFGKRGLLSAEIEQVNYSTMSISSETYGFESENQRIANKYQSATNLKVGGELAFDAFRIRAGYANLSSPFTGNSHTYRQHFLTAGFGIHEQRMSFDLAVIKQLGEEDNYHYTINEISSGPVKSSLNSTKIALTLAFKL
jgi:long-subunit fatty acid transport protein